MRQKEFLHHRTVGRYRVTPHKAAPSEGHLRLEDPRTIISGYCDLKAVGSTDIVPIITTRYHAKINGGIVADFETYKRGFMHHDGRGFRGEPDFNVLTIHGSCGLCPRADPKGESHAQKE